MSNTNVEYLEEQQKAQTPVATPATAAAPTSTTAVDGYGKFLETLANNKKIENTPTNAKTYADYLTYIGQDPVGEYQAKVRQANLDYAKGLATYGKAAEQMAKSGLTGSGYGEYLQGLAYQGKQSAVGAAQKEAQAAMKQSFSSYGDYLEGIKSTNEQNAINGIMNGLLEGDAAKEYARQQGVTEDRLDYILGQTGSSVSAAKQQKLADATSAITQLVDTGKTIDSAIAALNGVYDKDVLDAVKQNMQGANAQQIGAGIATSTQVGNFKAELDKQLGSGAIGLTDYEVQLAAASKGNLDKINAYVNGGDISGLSDYIASLATYKKDGTTVKKSGEEVWAEMSKDERSDKITEWADQLYASGNLNKKDYQSFFYDSSLSSLQEDTDSANEFLNFCENISNQLASGRISQEQYNQLVAASAEMAEAEYGKVDVDAKSNNNGGNATINYKQGEYGKESISIRWDVLPSVSGDGFVEGKSVPLKGQKGYADTTLVIGMINGRVAYKVGNKYYQAKSGTPEYLNNKQNAAFIAYMMVP